MSSLIPSQVVKGNHLTTASSHKSLSDDDPSNSRIDILHPSSDYEGDHIEEKNQHVFRIGVINIHGIPKKSSHPKNINIKETINNYNFNYMGITESNCYWPEASHDDQWHERIKSWWTRSKSEVAYHRYPTVPTLHQPGGVVSIALRETTNTVAESGQDKALGRWS